MENIVISETEGNPFPSKVTLVNQVSLGFSHASTEGYYHNPDLIKRTIRGLVSILGVRKGSKTIDIGYGQNLAILEAMQELGMESYGLDSQDGLDKGKYIHSFIVPPYFNTEQNGIRKYCGTIEDILHPQSELKDERFDLFTFWGSWESGGNNFAIGGEMGEFRAITQLRERAAPGSKAGESRYSYDNAEVRELMRKNKQKVMADSKAMLNPGGGLLVVSSRYAGHGAGFATDQLPFEKRGMLGLGNRFKGLGAKQIYFFGVSKEEVKKQLAQVPYFAEVSRALEEDGLLFASAGREAYEFRPSPEDITAIKNMNISLGRIDAVYGKF
ncbi:MAG: hypothetical protein Q8Q31_04480 [Nanoarchaeota archaeon]|nr:hypothetical protein [Nanoarchaeota archaeon]